VRIMFPIIPYHTQETQLLRKILQIIPYNTALILPS